MAEKDLVTFEETIGMRLNPEEAAKEALRAHQAAAGMTFENPDAPVSPDDKARAWMEDEEIGGGWMGQR